MDTKPRRLAACRAWGVRLPEVAILALVVTTGLTSKASAQPYCRVEYTTWNSNRYVFGPVDAECSGVHSKPFGNWGVKTESTGKKDGYQFEGWCRNHRTQDPASGNRWKTFCRDPWYQWNSCTLHAWAPPNRGFYNHNNYRQQKSTTGRSNNHGGGVVSIATMCPTDTNGDGTPDTGGCKDVLQNDFTVSGHRMELYELDPLSRDSHVETLYFPDLVVSTANIRCDPEGCTRGVYGAWKSPKYKSAPITSAQVTAQIRAVYLVDPYKQCSRE